MVCETWILLQVSKQKMQVYYRCDVVAQRYKYLKKVQDLRSQGYEIFYQDDH